VKPNIRFALPGVWLAFIVFALAILVPAALMVYTAVRETDVVRRAAGSLSPDPATARARPGPLAIADLPALPEGRRELHVAPPAGGFAAFDAVAELPWAVTIGRAWAGDARLERIDVERVHPDGLVNAEDDAAAGVTYRFLSPDRVEELRREADLSADASVVTELFVGVAGGQVTAQAIRADAARLRMRGREVTPPAHPRALTLAETFTRLSHRPGYEAPFYKGYLINLEREGWVWYFSTPSGTAFPRVRCTDAAPYPYK
jgi:hypothetical protein